MALVWTSGKSCLSAHLPRLTAKDFLLSRSCDTRTLGDDPAGDPRDVYALHFYRAKALGYARFRTLHLHLAVVKATLYFSRDLQLYNSTNYAWFPALAVL